MSCLGSSSVAKKTHTSVARRCGRVFNIDIGGSRGGVCSCPLFFLSVRYFRSGRERNPCRVQIYTHPAYFCMSWEVSSCVAKRSEATEFTLSFIEPFPSAMCLVLSGRSGVIFVAQPLLPRACCCATCLVAPRLTVDELDWASSLRREGPGPIDIHAALNRRCAGKG